MLDAENSRQSRNYLSRLMPEAMLYHLSNFSRRGDRSLVIGMYRLHRWATVRSSQRQTLRFGSLGASKTLNRCRLDYARCGEDFLCFLPPSANGKSSKNETSCLC